MALIIVKNWFGYLSPVNDHHVTMVLHSKYSLSSLFLLYFIISINFSDKPIQKNNFRNYPSYLNEGTGNSCTYMNWGLPIISDILNQSQRLKCNGNIIKLNYINSHSVNKRKYRIYIFYLYVIEGGNILLWNLPLKETDWFSPSWRYDSNSGTDFVTQIVDLCLNQRKET